MSLHKKRSRIFGTHYVSEWNSSQSKKDNCSYKWEAQNSVKQVHDFLGLCNYYITFVKNFCTIVSLLTNLTKNDVKFEWLERCEK